MTISETERFQKERQIAIKAMAGDADLQTLTRQWFDKSCQQEYSYNFSWMGRPIIQFPQDILAMQELIWSIKPELIIETGIARGGSLIFYASMLELLGDDGFVLGIDIDIRQHNRVEIEQHPMFKRIRMIEGSSISADTAEQVYALAEGKKRILVVLDSNHTHEHVAKELEYYAPLVSVDSYIVVFDTVIEDMPSDTFPNRPWGKGDNPKTAVDEFLKTTDQFVVDEEISNKLLISVAPRGYLRRVRK